MHGMGDYLIHVTFLNTVLACVLTFHLYDCMHGYTCLSIHAWPHKVKNSYSLSYNTVRSIAIHIKYFNLSTTPVTCTCIRCMDLHVSLLRGQLIHGDSGREGP